jgi:hypothetical protein
MMVEISSSDLSVLENSLVAIKSAVSRLGEHSPEVLQIIESIVEAEKIVLSKLDKNKS